MLGSDVRSTRETAARAIGLVATTHERRVQLYEAGAVKGLLAMMQNHNHHAVYPMVMQALIMIARCRDVGNALLARDNPDAALAREVIMGLLKIKSPPATVASAVRRADALRRLGAELAIQTADLALLAKLEKLSERVPQVFAPFRPALRERKREINYCNDLAATERQRADGRAYFNVRELKEMQFLFQQHDKDKSGEISEQELIGIFKTLKKKVPKRRLKRLIAEYDEDGSGEISFGEFCCMMRSVRENENTSFMDSFVPDFAVRLDSEPKKSFFGFRRKQHAGDAGAYGPGMTDEERRRQIEVQVYEVDNTIREILGETWNESGRKVSLNAHYTVNKEGQLIKH